MAKYIANSANGYYQLELEVDQTSQDVANNTSTLSWYLRLRSIAQASFSQWNVTQSAAINGTVVLSQTTQPAVGQYATVLLGSGSHVVTHEADGTKTVAVSASIDTPYQSYLPDYISVSGSLALTTIPRATTPTLSASTIEMDTAVTINLPRASESFTHDVTYTFGSASGTIATGAGTSSSWTPPVSLASQIPNATSGVGTITVVTKSGSTSIGTKYVNFTLTVPSTVVPTISSASFTNEDAAIQGAFGAFLRYKSKIKATISAAGVGGSTIKSITFAVDISNITAYDVSSATLTTPNFIQAPAGTYPNGMYITVVDSRGRSGSASYPVTIVDYFAPKINGFSAIRTNASGEPQDNGQYAKIFYSFEIAPVNNTMPMLWAIERFNGASWVEISSGVLGHSTNTSLVTGALFNPDSSHIIRLRVQDYFSQSLTASSATFTIPTSSSILDFKANKKGMAIGKASENDGLEIAWNTKFQDETLIEGGVRKPSRVIETLSSPGWYRVAKFDAAGGTGLFGSGAVIQMEMTRTYVNNNNEAHAVTLIGSYQRVNFFNQKTVGAQLIEGIRWQYDTNNSYLDIYYSGTASNQVTFSITSVNGPVSFTNYEPFTNVTNEATMYGSTDGTGDGD